MNLDDFYHPNKDLGKKLREIPEEDIVDDLVSKLIPFFNIRREVESVDKKYRIDLVLNHRSDLYDEYPMGMEIKRKGKKSGSHIVKFLKQASNYKDVYWEQFGQIPVFVYPQITGLYFNEGKMMHPHSVMDQDNNVSTFINSVFGVGELKIEETVKNGTHIEIQKDRKRIWVFMGGKEYYNEDYLKEKFEL